MTNSPLKLIHDIEKDLQGVKDRITDISNDVGNLQDEAKRLELTIKDLSGSIVTKEKFAPYEKLLGAVGVAIILTLVASLLASILK